MPGICKKQKSGRARPRRDNESFAIADRELSPLPRHLAVVELEALAREAGLLTVGKAPDDLAVCFSVVDELAGCFVEIEDDAQLAVAVEAGIAQIVVAQLGVSAGQFCEPSAR